MADYQRVVEFLRDLRQAPVQAVTEEISQCAREYAELCVQANERLRRCSTFLQQGLRSESIHLAEENPNLLDLVAALDLPDPEEWADFCLNNGLPVPPSLQMDRAAQLNDAYAADQPMEHLMARHRYLALSRAPVRERLAVMRQITQLDPGNASWDKDIQVFENARLRELPTTFYNAVRNRDEAGIIRLVEEVTKQSWREPLPADLVEAVTDAHTRMTRAHVEEQLQKLVEPLRDAFAARSLKECQSLMQRWKNIMVASSITTVSHELTDEAKPVVAWISEEEKREEKSKRFKNSCRIFDEMLARDAADSELESAYAKLQDFDQPVSPELTARYADRRASRQKNVERKHKLRLVLIAGLVIAIIAVSFGGFYLYTQFTASSQWATRITRAVDDRDPLKAAETVAEQERLAPQFNSDPRIIAAKKGFESLKLTHETDVNNAKTVIALFESLDNTYAPVAANLSASLDELLQAATSLQDGLSQGRAKGDLGWVDTSKKIPTLDARLSGLLASLKTRATAVVKNRLDELNAEFDGLDLSPAQITANTQKLTLMGSTLRRLSDTTGIDEDTRIAATSLLDKIDKKRTDLGATRDISTALQTIRVSALSADDLKRALDDFILRFPAAPQTADFKIAAERLPAAKSVELWRSQVNAFGKRFHPPSQATAQRRVDSITAYLTAHPDSPFTASASAYSDYLKRAVEALQDKGTWQTAFADLLATPMLADLNYMETTDGKTTRRYYTMGDIHLTNSHINELVTVRFDALDPKDLTKRRTISVEPPEKLVFQKPQRVAHAKVAEDMADAIKAIDESNWDTFGIDWAEKLARNPEMDLVVKAILLQQTLQTQDVVDGWALSDVYAKTLTELARQQPQNISWIDPEKVTDGTRKALRTTMESLPTAASVKQELANQKAALWKSITLDLVGTGVLLKDDNGQWELHARSGVITGNIASVVLPAATPDKPASFVKIATVVNDKFELLPDSLVGLPQGTLVYIQKP